jgi:hypothetical protein
MKKENESKSQITKKKKKKKNRLELSITYLRDNTRILQQVVSNRSTQDLSSAAVVDLD